MPKFMVKNWRREIILLLNCIYCLDPSRYEEYRSEYISTQKRAFFEAHKDEEWLF